MPAKKKKTPAKRKSTAAKPKTTYPLGQIPPRSVRLKGAQEAKKRSNARALAGLRKLSKKKTKKTGKPKGVSYLKY